MAKAFVYEIEGELLTRPEILERCPGIRDVTLQHRLGKGNRTWNTLRQPPHITLQRNRDKMRKIMSAERETTEFNRQRVDHIRMMGEAGLPRNLDGTEATDRRNPRCRKTRF